MNKVLQFFILLLSSNAHADTSPQDWQGQLITNSLVHAIHHFLGEDNPGATTGLIHALAHVDSDHSRRALVDLASYYLGESNAAELSALIVNQGQSSADHLRAIQNQTCKDKTYCLELRMRLAALDTSKSVEDMDLPGFRLHQLKGDRAGYWAIDISGNWRLTFRFEETDAYDLNYEDYH